MPSAAAATVTYVALERLASRRVRARVRSAPMRLNIKAIVV